MKTQILLLIGLFAAFGANAQRQNQSLKDTIIDSKDKMKIIEIKGEINRYYEDSSSVVGKLPLRQLENPQVYQVISKNIITDQVATQLNDVMKNATGVTRLWESTGRGGDGAEFYTLRGFSVQPNLINGVPGISNGGIDPANIESVDVVKGPSATLFGSTVTSYGGMIQINTKRALSQKQGNFGIVLGNNNHQRTTADINIPINNQLSVRLNSAYQQSRSFQDAGFGKMFLFAPAVHYKANNRLTFDLLTSYQKNETAIAPMIFLNRYAPLSFHSMDLFQKNYFNSFTSNDLSLTNPTLIIQGTANFQMNENWKSQTIISKSSTSSNGYYQYLWDMSNGNDFFRYISKRNGATETSDIQQNFIAQHKHGKWSNKAVFGIDYYNSEIINSSTGWVGNGLVSLQNGSDSGLLTSLSVDSLLTGTYEGESNAQSEIMSTYFSDIVTFDNKLSVMLSLRADRFSGSTAYWSTDKIEEQNTLSPKLGLVYHAWKTSENEVVAFANYMNGFINQAPVLVSDLDGTNQRMKILTPEQANQKEIGVKTELMDQKIAVTASVYDILVNNKVMSDPNNFNNVIQEGQVQSKGYECSITARPIEGLQMIAGYSKNDAKVIRDNEENGYLNLRPEEAGPSQLVNYWIQYSPEIQFVKGLSLGLGGNYASQHLTLNRSTTGTFALPAYHILNSSIQFQKDQYQLILKVNNLFNQKYYSGWSGVNPQNLRNVQLSMNYSF
jgi:iron complex outermembrane receptor protein